MQMSISLKRAISFLLAVVTFFSCVPIGGFLEVEAAGNDGTSTASVGAVSGISLELEWEDSQFKNGTAFSLREYNPLSNVVKMKVSYGCSQIRATGYQPGDLIITVKGIGNVNRSGKLEAVVGADKEGEAIKTRDWTYTWNSANDTYTFTNNEAIEGSSVLSGYFELVWEIEARKSVHNYSQEGIFATLYLPEGESVQSQVLSFSNETKADTFKVDIERKEMYSYEGLTSGITNPDNYVFIRYNLGAATTENSRGLKSHYFLFNGDSGGVGSGAVVISPKIAAADAGGGNYRVEVNTRVSMDDQYVFVAYPKDQYVNKTVTATFQMYGAYHEGDDSGNTTVLLLARDEVNVVIPNDFNFTDIPGHVYDFWKDTWYDAHVSSDVTQARGGDLNGSKLKLGTTETFYLEGELNNSGENYTLEIVDDFLYILKNNGEFRQLEAGEYEFKSITIPGASSIKNINDTTIAADTYKASVYVMTGGAAYSRGNAALVWSGVIKEKSQTISAPEIPANTTAIAVVIEGITESLRFFSIPVSVNFHVKDTAGLEESQQDNLTGGQVVNTSFVKVYTTAEDGSVSWFNAGFTEDNYLDDTNLKLAQKDIAVYGNYLDRERDNITLYSGEKNDYSAYTKVESLSTSGNRYVTTVTMGAEFKFTDGDHPRKFSLYTILPEGLKLADYKLEEDIWNIMELSGLDMEEDRLAAACTPEVIQNYNESGRTYIALHFDFGNAAASQKSNITAKISVKTPNYDNIFVRSAVVIDEGIDQYTWNKYYDNGRWGDKSSLFQDIDRDGDAEELLAYNYDYATVPAYADSSQLVAVKYVKTTYSDGWTLFPDVPYEEYGGIYQYKLYIRNGNSTASGIVIKDFLESGANSQWQGSFRNVDLSSCEAVGMTGTVYYSAMEDPGSLDSGNWTTHREDGTDCRAIAVDFGGSVLGVGQEMAVIINMKAPKDTALREQTSENGFSLSFTMYDSTTGNQTKLDNVESNLVQVKLTPPLKSIIITKQDTEDGMALAGAVFQLIDKESGSILAEEESNAKGFAIFHNVPSGFAYIVRELKAPYGYEAVADTEVTVGSDNIYVTVENPRKTGRIEVCKVNNLDGATPVADAEYSLFSADGNAVATAVTDVDGVAVFENVLWGSYVIKETASPNGYQLNESVYTVEISRENVEETAIVDTADVQDDVWVHLIKYVKTVSGEVTNIPLGGAAFELMKKIGTEGWRIGLYVTDADGKIDVTDLPYGEYYFREYRAPAGYTLAENVGFTLSPQNKEVNIPVYDQRQGGSIIITKADNLGNQVAGIEFSLYAEQNVEAVPIAVSTTDEYGVARMDNLEWGTYYLKETDAPDYYVMDEEWKEIVIGGTSLEVRVDCVNETVKGAVILTKTDETGLVLLPGAKYNLYADSGKVLGTYVTDLNGQILVEGLEWGSYYFKETAAPAGYGLSDETIRFSVNALNAGITQEISVTDPLDARTVTLTKRIRVDDIHYDHGNPTFLFKVEGQDYYLKEHTYYRVITFDQNYVKNNIEVIDGVEYVSQSVTISGLVLGHYVATEEESSRYCLSEIVNVVNGLAKQPALAEGTGVEAATVMPVTAGPEFYAPDEVGVKFDLITYKDASAVFVNAKYENQGCSDNETLMNVLKEQAKLTALKAVYGAKTAEAESEVDMDLLTVTAIYDDGTTKVLSAEEYSLSITSFPNVNGDYTVTVSYAENGITRSGNFTVEIYGAKKRIVRLEASLNSAATVETGAILTPQMFNVIAVYNDGDTQQLYGGEQYTMSSPKWPNAYPNSMDRAWEKKFEGANSVQITFDPTSVTYDTSDYIYIYGTDTSSKLFGPLSGHYLSAKTYLVPGDYVYMRMKSDSMNTAKGFSATLTPIYDVPVAEFTLSATTAPAEAGDFTVTINLNLDKVDNHGYEVATTVTLEATSPKPILGPTGGTVWSVFTSSVYGFSKSELNTITDIVFTDIKAPTEGVTVLDVSQAQNGSVVAWIDGATMYVSSQRSGVKILANRDSRSLFNNNYGYFDTLERVDFSNLDTSEVFTMKEMFYDCSALKEVVGISEFDVSGVGTMSSMFEGCTNLQSLDLSKWNTASLQNTASMFEYCSSLSSVGNLSGWSMGAVFDMDCMFYKCSSLTTLDVSGWNTGAVEDMHSVFSGCTKLTSLDLSDWDVGSVEVMQSMFYNCVSLNSVGDLSEWNVSSVDTMLQMFYNCRALTELDLSGWSTSAVRNFSEMFNGCTNLHTITGISRFNTGSATDMKKMFADCAAIPSLDLSTWITANVTDLSNMFDGCTLLDSVTFGANFVTDNVTSLSRMFQDCESLISLDLSAWNTGKVSSMNDMFSGCKSLTSVGDLSGWDTYYVEYIGNIFRNCSSMETLVVRGWNLRLVSSLSGAFEGCSSLKTVDISGWNIRNVTGMYAMFSDCSSLTEIIGIEDLNVSKVTDMRHAFRSCSSLTSFDFSKWDVTALTETSGMFYACNSIVPTEAKARCQADTDKLNASLSKPTIWEFNSVAPVVTLTIDCPDTVTVTIPETIEGGVTELTVTTVAGNQALYSFKVDGKFVEGNTFMAPTVSGTVAITDVDLLTVNCPDTISIDLPDVVKGGVTELALVAVQEKKAIASFKLNGETVEGYTFTVPETSRTVTITDVILIDCQIIESEHNPYPNSMNTTTDGIQGKVYGEVTFDGAVSLTVLLDCQTENTRYDWIYLYDAEGNIVNNKKYGGSTRTQEVITVTGNYVKIIFRTDSYGNAYYGFHATITPNYG